MRLACHYAEKPLRFTAFGNLKSKVDNCEDIIMND